MKIRTFRTFEWVLAVPLSQVQFGGKNPYTLKHTDTPQRYDENMEMWVDVEVVEDQKPPHPDEARRVKLSQGYEEQLHAILAASSRNLACE
jgi:hypothetical protein